MCHMTGPKKERKVLGRCWGSGGRPGFCRAWRLGGVIAASGSVPHRVQLRPQHLQPLRSMCWGGTQPSKVGLSRCPACQPQPHLGAQAPIPPTALAGMSRTLSWSRIWATSSPACHSSGCGIRCARAGLPPSRDGEGWQGREAKILTLCAPLPDAAAFWGEGAPGPPLHQCHGPLQLPQ